MKSLQEELAQDAVRSFASGMLSAALSSDDSLQKRVTQHFPWILALSEKDQRQCVGDLIQAAQIALSTGQGVKTLQLLKSWEETARAVAAGLSSEKSESISKPKRVSRPKPSTFTK